MNNANTFALQGDICYSESLDTLRCMQGGYLVCDGGLSRGAFETLPEQYKDLPLFDYSGKLIIPGLVDLHMHAPQHAFRGLGMDSELLDWLNAYAFPEEAKYEDMEYAQTAYEAVVQDIAKGPNTRACIFATIHLPATILLMDMLENSGLVCMVGKINMDRNCPEYLREKSAARSAADTRLWLESVAGSYDNVRPILTPRFLPVCSNELMQELASLQKEFGLPVQSHLSENRAEIDWVRELHASSKSYGHAYEQFGLFGGAVPTVMAHCVWPDAEEMELMQRNQVYVAHCPQSNMNLSSGIAPIRRFLNQGIPTGLGSDVAGGCHSSIFRAMADAIQASKIRYTLVNRDDKPLTIQEVFYLGTLGGGSFFGNAGSFMEGYEFDAVVIDDNSLSAAFPMTMEERLARAVYTSDDRHICAKYARGKPILTGLGGASDNEYQ